MKFTFTLCLIVLAACSLSFASVQGSFQRTFQVSGPVNMEVLTHSGDVTVHSGPAGSVTISGNIHVSDSWFHTDRQNEISELEKNPPVRQSGNAINIDYANVRDISIDYDITAPADTTLRTRTNSGNQDVSGLTTNLDLQSDSGDMRLSNVSGGAKLHTVRETSMPTMFRAQSQLKPEVETFTWRPEVVAMFMFAPVPGTSSCAA
jgi:hypothetical protein